MDLWLQKWAADLIVFGLMLLTTGLLAFLGYLKVRKIRGPRKTIESVKEARVALTPGGDRTPGEAFRADGRSLRLVMARSRGRTTQPPPDPSITRIAGPWRHMDVHANGIRFHVVEANPTTDDSPADQPLVMLLHGFGSFWWSWRHQLRGLSGARVVAVDLRGYGGSDKPPRGYDGWTLAGDTAGLVRALGHETATLVGHADGGLVCWATSVLHPRVVRSIAVVSSPHPVALRASALTRRDQGMALLPWMMRYQLPFWPERSLTR